MNNEPLQHQHSAYTPINCSYYDQLEAWAVKRDWVNVTYLATEGDSKTVRGIIRNLITRNHEEYMELSDGSMIRLDQLIEINGKALPKAC